MSSVRDRVRQFILANFYVADAGALGDDDSLMAEGIVDSTGMLDVILFLEEEMKIHIEDTEMIPDNLDSIARIDAFVGKKQAAR